MDQGAQWNQVGFMAARNHGDSLTGTLYVDALKLIAWPSSGMEKKKKK